MKAMPFKTIALLLCLPSVINAADFLGSIYCGYGQLLRPDAVNETGAKLRTGGVEAVASGLWGSGNIKFGAETGIMEAYTNWDKNGKLLSKYSLAYIPVNAVIQYEFRDEDEALVPFVFTGPGAYFKIEGGSSAETAGRGGQTNSSNACFGLTGGIGARWQAFSKTSINFGCRYTYINDTDNVSLFSPFLGISSRVSFSEQKKKEDLKLPISR